MFQDPIMRTEALPQVNVNKQTSSPTQHKTTGGRMINHISCRNDINRNFLPHNEQQVKELSTTFPLVDRNRLIMWHTVTGNQSSAEISTPAW